MFRSMFVRSFWKGSKEIPQRSSNAARDAFNGIHVIQIPFNVDITGGPYSIADATENELVIYFDVYIIAIHLGEQKKNTRFHREPAP